MQPSHPGIDFRSPEWGKVREWLAGELQETLLRLASRTITEREADYQRGKAGFINTLLDFTQDDAASYGR